MSTGHALGAGASSSTFFLPMGTAGSHQGRRSAHEKGVGMQSCAPVAQGRTTGPGHGGVSAELGVTLVVCFQLLPHAAHHLRPRSQLPSRATLATGEPATKGQPPSRASSNSWSHRVGRGLPGLLGRILKNKSPLGSGIPCELR